MTSPQVLLLGGGLLALSAATVACATDEPDVAPPVTATVAVPAASTSEPHPVGQAVRIPGVTAILEQYREDEIQGLISVKTTNRSTSTIVFEDLRLVWPGIAATEPYVRSTQLSPGIRLDLRVQQGTAACGDPPATTSIPPTAAAVAIGNATIDGAAATLVEIPIDDEDAILPRVFARSCQDQRVRWAADIRFGDSWTTSTTASGEPAVLGTLELRRNRSDETLTITEINGSVLLRIGAVTPSQPVATLAPGDDAATIPIRIVQSGNCADHALAESKKTFIIPIDLAIGADESLAFTVRFDTAAQQVLNPMINESCGVG
jgi:hypothetical protein